MKKYIAIFCALSIQLCVAQNTNTHLDLGAVEIANSPTLSLLDNTAAVIVSNPDQKEFSVNTENLSKISFEVSPVRSKLTGLDYYGLGDDTAEWHRLTSKFFKPLFSGGINQTDSITIVAIGISTNILKVYSKNGANMLIGYQKFKQSYVNLIGDATNEMTNNALYSSIKFGTHEYYSTLGKVMDSLQYIAEKEFPELLKKPLLTFDIAAAYSLASPFNKIDNITTDRLGIWGTLSLRPGLLISKHLKDLAILGFIRYLKDDNVYIASKSSYTDNFSYVDFGGKIEYDFRRFSLGYEYIKRTGDGIDFRSVGFLQYKINKYIYLTGGFGKNFEMESGQNLLTFFGIRWGFNKSDSRPWQ